MRLKENFDLVTINRRDIHGAPYNPRKISESAKKKLRKSLKDFGVLQPVVVNKNTMNIVAGHQRIAAMDDISGGTVYEIRVCMVDLTEEQEVKANVILNNTGVMGEFDIDALADLKNMMPEIDFVKDFGFDEADLRVMFAGNDAADIFGNSGTQNEEVSEVERIAKSDKMKEAKKKERDLRNPENVQNDYQKKGENNLLTIVFNTNEEKGGFMKRIHKPEGERFIKPQVIYDIQVGKLRPFGPGVV